MTFLSITALLHNSHDDILGGHERQLLGDPPSDNGRIHDEALANILGDREEDVSSEESARQADSSDSGVIEGAFEPLHGASIESIL